MANREYITVEELNFYINNVFLNEELLHNVPVMGEVSGASYVGGHCYFTLKDAKAQIKCVYFNCPISSVPKNGAKVLVQGSVDFYTKGGQINLKVYAIVNVGIGLLHEEFQKLHQQLEEEGLFREDHKLPIPAFPRRVAVVTSIKGAAVQDFIATVRKYNQIVDITIIDVRVQGDYAATDIVEALVHADDYAFDVIVVARGGGSFEDLFCFNDESLVRTIYAMHTPVISAVGHETDYTLCDYVADKRAITPTAAAEIIGYSSIEMNRTILNLTNSISILLNQKINNKIDLFLEICDEMQSNMEDRTQMEYAKVLAMCNQLKIFANRVYDQKKQETDHLLTIIEGLNPLKLLNRGYFRILSHGEYVYEVKNLKDQEQIIIVGIDGKVNAVVCKEGGAK